MGVVEMNFHNSQNQNSRDFWKTVNQPLREKDKHTDTVVDPKELLSHFQN